MNVVVVMVGVGSVVGNVGAMVVERAVEWLRTLVEGRTRLSF